MTTTASVAETAIDRDSVRQLLARLLLTMEVHNLTGMTYQRADAETGRLVVRVADAVQLEAWRAVLPNGNEVLRAGRSTWFDVRDWAPGWGLTVEAVTS